MLRKELLFTYSVFALVFINIVVFILQLISGGAIDSFFALTPVDVLNLKIWQIITYSFLHSRYDIFHIIINMYILVMFGLPVEAEWGRKRFIRYYLICALGAGVSIFLLGLFTSPFSSTLGASGAVYGVMLAFALMYPKAQILLFFVVPVSARTMIILYTALELFLQLSGVQANVSHIGHLGGLLTGLLYFLIKKKYLSNSRRFVSVENSDNSDAIISSPEMKERNRKMKKDILEKLSAGGGVESLSDDEWQFLKYLEIMETRRTPKESSGGEQLMTDAEFMAEVKKHITL